LQAYLGDKKYGEKGMDALRKAGRKHASKTKMQNIRAKFSNKEEGVAEGHQVVPGIDREKYTERPGLEGPFSTKSGKVVYYDKQEGKYYDPGTDFYISHDDYQAMNEQGVAEGMNNWALKDKHTQIPIPRPPGKNNWSKKDIHNRAYDFPPTNYDKNGRDMYGQMKPELTSQTEGTGSSIERILAAHPEAVENFKQGGDLDYDLESDLWEYYFNNGEIRNYDADASEFISQRLADELGLSEGLDANQKRVGQLGPTEKVKNNNIGKLVGANENFINTVDQAVVSEEDEMAESILSAIKKVGKKVIDTVAPGDEELLKQLDKDVHGGKVPNRYNSDAESAKKYPADSRKVKVDESSDELARILTIMNHRR